MTTLRQKMIEDLRLRGMSRNTEKLYVSVVAAISRRYGCSPEDLDYAQVREYLLDLRERGREASTLANYWSAFRALFVDTLGRDDFIQHVPRPRVKTQPGRVAPTIGEVRSIFDQARCTFDRTFFQTCYGAGLRLDEALHLQVADIDAANELLHVRNGKGGKARAVHLGPELLEVLRSYWREVRPGGGDWVFPARRNGGARDRVEWAERPMSPTTMQRRFREAVAAAKLRRHVTLHDLRRAYATHMLEHGVELRMLQVALGHSKPSTTAVYAHVSVETLCTMPCPLKFL
jgi:integrase